METKQGSRLKILFITHLFPNPLEPVKGTFNVDRANALMKKGVTVMAIVPIGLTPPMHLFFPKLNSKAIISFFKKRFSIPKHLVMDGIEVCYVRWYWLPHKFFWGFDAEFLHLFGGLTISRLIKYFKPEAIISSYLSPGAAYAKYVKKKFAVSYVSILEGSDVKMVPYEYSGIDRIVRDVNKYVDKIIFPSHSLKNETMNKLGLKPSLVIQNGFDADLFYLNNEESKNVTERIRLVSVGRLINIKGHDILLEVMSKLESRFSLHLVGSGDLKNKYDDYVENKHLSDRVQLVGEVHHPLLRELFQTCDIGCMPSRMESFGIALIEMMACGLPVVASDIPSFKELIIDGFNGFLFRKDDPEDMKQKIMLSAKHPWDHRKISKWVFDNFSSDRWAKEILDVIASLQT